MLPTKPQILPRSEFLLMGDWRSLCFELRLEQNKQLDIIGSGFGQFFPEFKTKLNLQSLEKITDKSD